MYALLEQLVSQHHEELERTNARIALAWCTSWKSDVDGPKTIGKCKRASDLDRELAEFDFIILLDKDFWIVATEKQRAALVDHELCHAAVKYDADGEPIRDERGRQVFRTRRHDLEEFSDIAARHGCYKRDLEQFAKALDRARAQTGTGWVGYASLSARLEHAGLHVPIDRILDWSEGERRQALEWCNIRREIQKASTGGAVVPPAPVHVLSAVVPQSLLEQQGA